MTIARWRVRQGRDSALKRRFSRCSTHLSSTVGTRTRPSVRSSREPAVTFRRGSEGRCDGGFSGPRASAARHTAACCAADTSLADAPARVLAHADAVVDEDTGPRLASVELPIANDEPRTGLTVWAHGT